MTTIDNADAEMPQRHPTRLEEIAIGLEHLSAIAILSERYELDLLVNHTRVRAVLQGVHNLASVILCNPCIDVQSLHGVIQIQRVIALEFSLVNEWQCLAKL